MAPPSPIHRSCHHDKFVVALACARMESDVEEGEREAGLVNVVVRVVAATSPSSCTAVAVPVASFVVDVAASLGKFVCRGMII